MFSLYEDNWHSGMYVVFALAPSSGLEIAMVKYLQHNFVFLLLHVLINVSQGVLSHAYMLVSHDLAARIFLLEKLFWDPGRF